MNTAHSAQASGFALLLLLFMALLAWGAVRHESVTVDEVAHIGAGVSYLQKLDMRMNEEHPPLAKVLAAIPLVLRGAHADYSHTSWTFSGEKLFNPFLGEWVFGDWFLLHWNNRYPTLLWARMPMLLITLLLGWVLYTFGSRLGGSMWGGLLCLAAFASMPVFIAFGPLVITDIAVTLFWILSIWLLPRMWHSPSRSQVLTFGLALAGAFLSKFSSGLLLFVIPAVALSMRLRPLPNQPIEKTELRRWRRQAWRNIGKALLWATLLVYIVYLILSWNQPADSLSAIHFPASPLLRRLFMPIWVYLWGLISFALSAGSRPTFILGHAYSHGVWFYFPVLFFLKTPLAFLLLLLLAVAIAVIVKRSRVSERSAIPPGMELHWRCIWVSLVVFTVACMLNRLDISIRHFSIPLALIILFLAPLPRMLTIFRDQNWRAAQIAKLATVALTAAGAVTAIAAYPNYFPFMNTLAAGHPAYLLVNDSNLDWNHGLNQVEKFVSRRGLKHVLLDAYGISEAQIYVPQAELWDCQQPSAADGEQWAVVSANLIADGANCRWLLRHLHLEIAGGSMYAFLLPKIIPAAGEPGGPPLPQDFRFFGGMPFMGTDIRTVFQACIRDPNKLQPTMDKFVAMMNQQRENQRQSPK